MDVRKNALIILISLGIGGLITYWLYTKYHILFFIVFIPIIGLGGRFITGLFKQGRGYNRYQQWDSPENNGDNFEDFDEGTPGDDRSNRGEQRRFLPRSGYLPPGDSSARDSTKDSNKIF
jgi:hypothetical protein